MADQKIPVSVPRVRDRGRNQEVPLTTSERFQAPRAMDTGWLQRVLGGLATREYARCAEAVPEACGRSASTVSRRFIRASARTRQTRMARRLDADDFVAVVLAGKAFAEEGMVTAVGVTVQGKTLMLGVVQTATDNQRVGAACLRALVERGLRVDDGLRVLIDGATGLHAAVFGAAALVQRGQWHTRENVISDLPEPHRGTVRRTRHAAYEQPTDEAAKRARLTIRQDLRLLNRSAVARLDEGFEETRTLHRLGLLAELGVSLKTTNALESIHARVEDRTRTVDHWKHGDHQPRWLATALLDLEPQWRRLKSYRALPPLRQALKANVQKLKTSA